ncbi:MAG: hypothetical protein L6Q37_01460 [Bdellovibrionaceae bacterium]|nr:hypothetical protein [Pseudobdellovibrionaceae bacterium]NUM59857.1 hypothetical protein [Pseudobdellovibrionaceae bacterium]
MKYLWIKKILAFFVLAEHSLAHDLKKYPQPLKASPFLSEQSFRSLKEADRTIYLLTLVHLAYILENLQTLPKESILPLRSNKSKQLKNTSWPYFYALNLNQAQANPVVIIIEAGAVVIKVARALSPILMKSFSRLAQYIKSRKLSKIVVETAGGIAVFEGASWVYKESNKELEVEEPKSAKETFSCLFGGHPSRLIIKDKLPICERPITSIGAPCTKEQFKCSTFGVIEIGESNTPNFCVNSNAKNIAQQCAKIFIEYLEKSSQKQNKSRVISINSTNYNEFTANLSLIIEDLQSTQKMESASYLDNVSLLTYCKELKSKKDIDKQQQEECKLIESLFSAFKKMEPNPSSEISDTSMKKDSQLSGGHK